MARIGVLHPGEMGAGIAGALVRGGHEVFWISAGRSGETAARAAAEGLLDAGDLPTMLDRVEIVVSICPPHAAVDVAKQVAGFRGLYLDANAISPGHAAEVAEIIEGAGGTAIDAGIIGGPPRTGTTRLYLSGEHAEEIAALFPPGEATIRIVEGDRFGASAVKMGYAAWTKGTAALMLGIRAMARANGVEADLVAEWAETQNRLLDTGRRAGSSAQDRGWRWAGEMEEIAATFRAVGLPGGFHEAAAEVYRRSPHRTGAPATDEVLDEVITALLQRS